MAAAPRHVLESELELALPDGSVVSIRPGPYKKGITVIPINPQEETTSRGRKPRAATSKLRALLRQHVKHNQVRTARDYVTWYLEEDGEVTLQTARQIVYRERRDAILEMEN